MRAQWFFNTPDDSTEPDSGGTTTDTTSSDTDRTDTDTIPRKKAE